MFWGWDDTVTGKIMTTMPIMLAVVVGFYLWNTDNELPQPINLDVLAGCYTSPGAPNWLIEGSELRIDQADLPMLKVAMRRGKRSRMVLVDRWLSAEAQADGTFLFKNDRGRDWKVDWKMNLETYPSYPTREEIQGPVRKIYLSGLKEAYSRTLPENCSNPS